VIPIAMGYVYARVCFLWHIAKEIIHREQYAR
jgi:hypothetical protein